MNKIIQFLFLLFVCQSLSAQQKLENLVIVTQLATAFAKLLGFDFKPNHPTMQPITQVISK